MSTDLRAMLRDAAGGPRRRLDPAALMQAARQRRRRRQRIVAGAAAAVIVALAGGSWVVLGGSGSRRSIHAGGPSERVVAAPGASLTVPAGWEKLPRPDALRDPAEILVVGTQARRPTGPILACAGENPPPAGSGVYVSIYEYAPTDTINQDLPTIAHDGSIVRLSQATPRPSPFVMDAVGFQSGFGADCPATQASAQTNSGGTPIPGTTGPTSVPAATAPNGMVLANHFREFVFSDHGRIFDARVVAVGDPSKQLLADGIAVLNTLQLSHGSRGGSQRPASPIQASGLECPQAKQPLSGSPDGLPMQGQTELPRVQAIKKAQGARIRRRFPAIVALTVEPRNGDVWRKDGASVVTIHAHDYWLVARLRHQTQCPTTPWTWDGIPLRFVVT